MAADRGNRILRQQEAAMHARARGASPLAVPARTEINDNGLLGADLRGRRAVRQLECECARCWP